MPGLAMVLYMVLIGLYIAFDDSFLAGQGGAGPQHRWIGVPLFLLTTK